MTSNASQTRPATWLNVSYPTEDPKLSVKKQAEGFNNSIKILKRPDNLEIIVEPR